MNTKVNDIEAKKRELIKKRRRNRLKRRFIVFVFILVCTGIIFTVLKAPFFNIQSIMCVGQQVMTEEEIIKIAEAEIGKNIFSTNVKAMKHRLASEPKIAESNVRRLYPNKIKIWVREAKTVASLESGGQWIFVDKAGKVINVIDKTEGEKLEDIAVLLDFEPASTKLGESIVDPENQTHKKAIECLNMLDKLELIDKTTSISTTDISDIRIDYDKRLYIMLGGYEQMEYKLTFIKKVITENLSKYERANLDYRGKRLYVGPRVEEEQHEEPANTDEENADEQQEKPGEKAENKEESSNGNEEQVKVEDN